MTQSTSPFSNKLQQPKWLRAILLSVLGYEALGCLLGGVMLIATPDGSLMDMPVTIMNGAFTDFLIPGIILFALGILNTTSFIMVFRRKAADWVWAAIALGGLLIWFWIEIAILQRLHWLHIMWGLPVVIGAIAATPLIPRKLIRPILLICGIMASALYIVINIIVPSQWPAYNSITQTVSELSAVAAPTRTLWIILSTPYTLLMIAFSWGVWNAAKGNRFLRITGGLLIGYSLLGILWPFAPMHLRKTLAVGGGTISDTIHIVLGVVTEIIYLLALALAAGALGRQFRIYSIITFIALLTFGILTFLEAPHIATNQPTPLIGLWERINIGIFLLWVILLAIRLLRTEKQPTLQQQF